MAVILLQVLVLGVIAAAAVDDDVPVTWVPAPRATLPCQVPDAARISARRPPPPLEGEDRPRPKPYLWRRDGEDFKRYYNASLEVFRRREQPAEGVYQCAVRQQGGLVLGYPVHLRFAHIDKQFSVQPANATAWYGQPYALTCAISSGPPAVISWIKDGVPLPDHQRYQLVNNQLIITEVTYEDVGIYRCRATNEVADKSRTSHGGRLHVEEAPADLQAAFLPVHHEASIHAARGTRVVLPCPVLGNPKPVLIWEMTPPGKRTGELESTDELLLMPTIAVDQAGDYTCRVVGHQDLVKRFNVIITTAVNITHPPESKQAVRASTVRFNCTARGTPTPNIVWYKDGKLLELQGRINVVASVDDKRLQQLLIRSVTSEDAGVYQCFARSGSSVVSAWATLNLTGGEAAAPADVRCWPAGVRDVALRWRNLTADVVAYTVQYTGPDNRSFPGQPVTTPEASINVKSPLTPYRFQVRAYLHSAGGTTGNKNTANRVSDMSESVTCQGQGVPIKLTTVSDGSILVSWREFYIDYPGVKQWILQHKPRNSADVHNVTLDGFVYNYTLNVSPRELLQVRVLGTRTLPWLQQNLTLVPWTASSAAGHYLGPGEVRAVPEDVELMEVSARNFTVRWRCGEETLSNTYSFMVCTRKVGGNEECIESKVNSAHVTNLQPDSEYEVRVQARLPGHTLGGDFSAPIPVTTPPEGQEYFRNLTYKYVNATTVQVSWVSDLKQYTVRYTYEYNLPIAQWNAVEADGNTTLLTELDPTKELSVIVEGHEPLSTSPLLTVPVQIPEAKDLQYTYTDEGLKVSWKGRGRRVVHYSQFLTQPIEEWRTIDVTNTSVLITDVDPSLRTFVLVATPGESSRNQVLSVQPQPGHEIIRNLTYKFVSPTEVRVSWISRLKHFNVRYTYEDTLPTAQWNAVKATGNSVRLTELDPTKELSVIVEGHEPLSTSPLLTVPVQIPEAKDLQYTYTDEGLQVSWKGRGPRVVQYSQFLTQPTEEWRTINVTHTSVLIRDVDPSFSTYVLVTAPGQTSHSQVLTAPPRPPTDYFNLYLGMSVACGLLIVCAIAAIVVCAWRRRKRGRSPRRVRGRSGDQLDAGGEEMTNIGDRLANGGRSKDAGEPLLNGHVHITENPTQPQTPNGKISKGQRYEYAFDVTRYDDADVTLETVLDPDTSAATAYHLLDTSRRAELDSPDITGNASFHKLPDGNMNSEVRRGNIHLENSKVLPTLQPNG